MNTEIKALLFDYGATLDSNGQHWAAVIWELYQEAGIRIDQEDFYAAYVYAEKTMAISPIIAAGFNFREVLEVKIMTQFKFLEQRGKRLKNELATAIAREGYLSAGAHTEASKKILEALSKRYRLAIVSNFYGNLNTVLRDFGMDRYFDAVIESAVVGVRKPDPTIYQLGVAALRVSADQCLVVGDSYEKDMIPAKACGCQTVWLKGKVWKNEGNIARSGAADHVISDIQELALLVDTGYNQSDY